MSEQRSGRGGPPKAKVERKRQTLTIRIRDTLKSELETAAEQGGRSLSEEIHRRLEMSLLDPRILALLRQIAVAVEMIERHFEASMFESRACHLAVVEAIKVILESGCPEEDAKYREVMAAYTADMEAYYAEQDQFRKESGYKGATLLGAPLKPGLEMPEDPRRFFGTAGRVISKMVIGGEIEELAQATSDPSKQAWKLFEGWKTRDRSDG